MKQSHMVSEGVKNHSGWSSVLVTHIDVPDCFAMTFNVFLYCFLTAEPVIRLSAPLPPSPRTQSPLPPPPTHAPPPVPGLSVKPTYATLERPTPSPPPPYDLDLENNKPMRPTLQSPEYESIDKIPSKMALVQQNEKSQTVLAMTMQQQ